MPLRRVATAVSPLLSAVEWAFCADVPCVDVLLGGVAAWWLGMQVCRPDVFVGRIRRPERPSLAAERQSTSDGIWAEVEGLKARQEAIDRKLVDQGHDIKQLRTMVNALPTHRQVSDLALEVSEMRGDLKVNSFQTSAMADAVKRIEGWIIEKVDKQ